MDNKALYNLSYGVFLLGTKNSGGKINACITNTCFQTANGPTRIAISVIKQNLTCQMIEESGLFTLSLLDKSCSFETIKRFGYQSGRAADKFSGFDYESSENGCPYITKEACSVIEAKVCNKLDLGSHVLFVAEVTDAKVLSDKEPLTYAEYQKNVKPKAPGAGSTGGATGGEPKKVKGWRCKICGYEFSGPVLPENFECPICGHPAEDFEPIYE
ncbi:MAG: flavin reductase [Treponema sp.]|nr:flavin reductase [Treponema sp.]